MQLFERNHVLNLGSRSSFRRRAAFHMRHEMMWMRDERDSIRRTRDPQAGGDLLGDVAGKLIAGKLVVRRSEDENTAENPESPSVEKKTSEDEESNGGILLLLLFLLLSPPLTRGMPHV